MNSLKYIILISVFCLVAVFSSGCGEPGVWQEPFPERLTISVVDSIGIEMGDSCYVLGAIADAEVTPSGTILLLDRSARLIRQFSSDGIHLSNMSRSGSGPGELSSPMEISVMPDGMIMIMDFRKVAVVVLSEQGEPLHDLTDWGLIVPTSLASLSDNRMAALNLKFDMVDSEPLIVMQPSVFSILDGSLLLSLYSDTLTDSEFEEALASLNGLMGSTVVVSDGGSRIFYCHKSASTYEILCWDSEGNDLFSASISIPPVEKTPQEILDETEYSRMQFAALGASALPEGFEPDPFYTLVENLGVDSDGNLWVQRGTEAQPVFDVFDTDGVHIASAEFPQAGRYWQFSITPNGSLAWNNDPLSGVQKVYMIELPVINI